MGGLSKYYVRKVVACFSQEMTATSASVELNINRNTINKYYKQIREAIADYQGTNYSASSIVNKDNSVVFAWHKNKGLCLDCSDSDSSFEIIEKDDKVFIRIIEKPIKTEIPDLSLDIKGGEMAVVPCIRVDEALTNSLKLPKTIRRFYYFSKEHLAKFYGIKADYLNLYLKEFEFRFNNRDKDITQIILKILPHHSKKTLTSNSSSG